MIKHIESDKIENLNLEQIRQIAKYLDIKVLKLSKGALVGKIKQELKKKKSNTKNFRLSKSGYYVFSKEIGEILRNKDVTKSEKFRRLFQNDVQTKDISFLTDSNYSFVYGVIHRYSKKGSE